MNLEGSTWRRYRLGDVARVMSGYAFKSSEFRESGIPVIKIKNIRSGYVDLSDVQYVGEKYLSLDKKYHVQGEDLLISLTGSQITQPSSVVGRVAIHSPKLGLCLLNQRAGKITVTNLDECNPLFLYYVLRTEDKARTIALMAHGSASQANVSPTQVEAIEIILPDVETQRKIAAILSAYDDLVENNNRRIKILEEIAQLIYREWFINFRFPGHENVKMVDSTLGMIPEGWEIKKASDAIRVNPHEKTDREGKKPYVAMEGLSIKNMIVTVTETRTGSNGAKFRNGDTLFARITPCLENGKTGFVQFLESDETIGIGSTEFIVFRSITLTPEYVYLLSRDEDFRQNAIKSMSGTSGRQRVRVECFDKYLIAQPDINTLGKFSRVIEPMFRNIYLLSLQIENLHRTRNLLLPQLISGEVDISDLDIDIGENAA